MKFISAVFNALGGICALALCLTILWALTHKLSGLVECSPNQYRRAAAVFAVQTPEMFEQAQEDGILTWDEYGAMEREVRARRLEVQRAAFRR